MQGERIRKSAEDPEHIFEHYENFKRAYMGTGEACSAAGVRFTPLIVEAHGGALSTSFRATVNWLASAVAAARGTDKSLESLRIAQRISATLQRENARAVLRRLSLGDEEAPPSSPWAGTEGYAHHF